MIQRVWTLPVSWQSALVLILVVFSTRGAADTITTVAGTGQPGAGEMNKLALKSALNQPFDVAVGSHGELFIADTFNHRVVRVNPRSGTVSLVAGSGEPGFSGDGGPAVKASLHEPYGLALDSSDNLYIVDRLNRRVRRVAHGSGTITTVAGSGAGDSSGDGGPAVNAGIVEPNGVAVSESGQELYIADVGGCRVRRVDLTTGRISTLAGTGVCKHEGDGGLARDAALAGPRAVEVGPGGSIYILEREGNRLRLVDAEAGLITTIAGTGAKGARGDGGPALRAEFNGPKEMAITRSGDILIVDTENHAIRRIDHRSRIVTRVAGFGQAGGSGDRGPAIEALLNRPHGVAVAPDGTIYIGDTNNNRVRKVTPR